MSQTYMYSHVIGRAELKEVTEADVEIFWFSVCSEHPGREL